MAVALIVAAGRGERLGLASPKALVPLGGRPLLEWSVAALREVDEVQEIVIALPAEHLGAAPPGTLPVPGGQVRSESVREALRAGTSGDPVIVHDAARPLAGPGLFRRALGELEGSGADAVIAAVPVADTIKEAGADGRSVLRTLDRSRLWTVQTPQVFRRAALQSALEGASPQLLASATDDAWLVEQAGGAVRVVPGEPANIKITTSVDLRIAELLMSR
jgi:2-C-methyl-D-erythritol 4-phosphate cytidylyltransferase